MSGGGGGRTSRIFIYEGMRDRSMRRGTLAREIQLTDWSTARNLSNRSSGVQIPRDISTRFAIFSSSVSENGEVSTLETSCM